MGTLAKITSCFVFVALISACGLTNSQILKTQSFGAATANIGTFGEEEFINIRNGIIEMNKELVAIDNTKKAGSLIFDKPASVEATATRVSASKALKLYGELLVKLVTEDRSENLQQVANSLLDNTAAALKHDLSDDKRSAINKLIVGLGSFWVERKKATAAREIIPLYQHPVDRLADLLRTDFSLDNRALGFLKAYNTTARRLKNASIRLVNAGKKYTVFERDRAVHALVLAEKAISRSEELSKKAQGAISRLKTANAELVKIIQGDKYSTDEIKAYAKEIQELVNMYQVITN